MTLQRRSFLFFVAACVVFLWSFASVAPLLGQGAGATLSGGITDNSGAAVPNATVSIRNMGTDVAREVTSNSDGFYAAPNLLPGQYEVKVTANGFTTFVQRDVTLNVSAEQTLNVTLHVGNLSQQVVVTAAPPPIQTSTSTVSDTVDSETVREMPLNGRDWASLASLEPGVISIPNQATTSFNANKGNRGFGNQLTNSGHRANENNYRLNGISINDYSNSAPGGPTGLNLGVDAIQEFSVLTTGYTAEYGRTSGAVISAITKSGTNGFHGGAYFFDRDSTFDARNFFDPSAIPTFHRTQFGVDAGGPIVKDKTFIFGNYEGVRQKQGNSGTIFVPTAEARSGLLCDPASANCATFLPQFTPNAQVAPYLALWPCPTACQNATHADTVSLNVSIPTIATENYYIFRVDHKFSDSDSLNGTYFNDAGPQSQGDPLGNTVHKVESRRQMGSVEENHIFNAQLLNSFRLGVSRVEGQINTPVSGDAVATDSALAIAPGAKAPPQIPVSGITTAFGLGGFNRFSHAWTSIQTGDDLSITHGTHAITVGFEFERMQYNVLERLSPNGRMNTYASLNAFLNNDPKQLNALAPGGSHEVGLRESRIATYIQDDWRARPNLTLNLGLRYEFSTRPTDSNTVPGYTVNGYTVAAAGFQEITTLANCSPGTTACGPVGLNSPIITNPTVTNFEPRVGFSWDPFHDEKTAIRAGFGLFDVLPLPYEFGLNTAATAPFQIIGADHNATLGSGIDNNVNFNEQKIRNRFIDPNPKRALVMNWNLNVERELAPGWSLFAGYVGSRSVHLSVAADDINLVQPQFIAGTGYVFPCDPSQISPYQVTPSFNTCANNQTGTRVDSNWGGGAGIRPVLFDGESSYNAFQAQLRRTMKNGVQGQISYTLGKCRDTSSAPVTGDTYLNSIAVPLLLVKAARVGGCDFDIRQALTGTFIWDIPSPKTGSALVSNLAGGWELGSIVTAETGAPFTVTVGDGNDPLGTGFNGDFSMDFASVLPNCKTIQGGVQYLNTSCFLPATAPSSLPPASAANPFGCAPLSSPNVPGGVTLPSGQQFCSNVLGNTRRNEFHGPSLVTWDFSIFKNNRVPKISENLNIQFRAEFFNILNHTNFLSPGFLNTFGQNNSVYDFDGSSLPTKLNQTSTSSRQIQLGLKVLW